MMYPVIQKLLHKHVVLASASPRRQEILSQAGLRFEVVPSRFKETLNKASFATPYAYAIETAVQKALEVTRRIHQKDLRAPDIVIGADTIVTVEGLILEKPVDKEDAYRMLSRLNGKEHSVFTGVAIIHCFSQDDQVDLEVSEFYEETKVTFSELSEELLWEYIDSGEPMDKAGGYGIQALGGTLVESIRGDFLNVVGFPLNRFCRRLAELYGPPRREALRRLRHDSIPRVGAFDDVRDAGDGAASAPHPHGGPERGAPAAHRTGTAGNPPQVPTGLLELIAGFQASKALFTACKLRVFDVLRDEGPLEARAVARHLAASESGTERLLDVCVALGLLESTDGGYRNSALAARYLPSDAEDSLHGLIQHEDEHTWGALSHLEAAVRQGPPAPGTGGGLPSQDGRHSLQDAKRQVLRGPHGFSKLMAHEVATAFDLSRFTSACDLGGSTGALAHELAREYPGLKVTVFDLREVTEHRAHLHPAGQQTEQVSFMPGDIFRDRLPEADLYILSGILHDWPDDQVHELLSRLSGSCKPGGGVLVAEVAVDKDVWSDQPGLLRALSRLLSVQGRQRGLRQYRQMLEQHGFPVARTAHAADILDLVLATRAAA